MKSETGSGAKRDLRHKNIFIPLVAFCAKNFIVRSV
jgi:hypothetical protein